MSFRENWVNHLSVYLRKKSRGEDRVNGVYRNIPYGYIINIHKGEDRLELIKKFNVLCEPDDFPKLIHPIHTYAHHMNSSQVMCYNFFRPMMCNIKNDAKGYYGSPTKEMVSFIDKKVGVKINPNVAKCRFEYTDSMNQYDFTHITSRGRGETSSFDFFIEDEKFKIFFEIKFTESGFGSWSGNSRSNDAIENHKAYFERGYSQMIDDSIVISNDNKSSLKSNQSLFDKYYQLFRNILKVNSENVYSVILFPTANNQIKKELNNFRPFIEDNAHIVRLNWEDLTDYMSDKFKEKYIVTSSQNSPKYVPAKDVADYCHKALSTNKDWEERFDGYISGIESARGTQKKYQVRDPFQQYTSVTHEGSFSYDLRVGGHSVATVKLKEKDSKIYLSSSPNQVKQARKYYPELKESFKDEEWLSEKAKTFRRKITRNYKNNPPKNSWKKEAYCESALLKEFSKKTDKKLPYIQPIKFPGGFSHMPTTFAASNHTSIPKFPGKGSIDIFARDKHKDGTPHLCVMELKDENNVQEPIEAVIAQATAYATFIAHLLVDSQSKENWWKLFMPGSKRSVKYFHDIDVVSVMPYEKESSIQDVPIKKIELKFKEGFNVSLNLFSLYFKLNETGQIENFEGSFKDILHQ